MHIYLVQHGAVVPKDENPEKPLSDSGRDDIKKMASFLVRSHVSAARVIHSGKLRALETALLLAEVLGPGNVVEEIESGLAPNDSTDALFAAIDGWTEDTIVVGTDYGHHGSLDGKGGDQSAQPQMIAEMKSREEVEPRLLDKILTDNPRHFYGL